MPAVYHVNIVAEYDAVPIPTNVTCKLSDDDNPDMLQPMIQLNNGAQVTLCDLENYDVHTVRCEAALVPTLDQQVVLDTKLRGRSMAMCRPDPQLPAVNVAMQESECTMRMFCVCVYIDSLIVFNLARSYCC
jgi:hypothetical protein